MAFTEFYCNASTGSNMNGGSDENTSPSYSHTNGGWNSGTGVFTPTSGDPSASGVSVGQFASVFDDGATTPVFVGRVTAVNSTTITVSTTAKSGTAPTTNATGRSINVGGVWKGPNGSVNFPCGFVTTTLTNAASDLPRVNFKNNATYSISAVVTANQAGPITWQGYSSTVGDGGRATLDGSTNAIVLLSVTGANNSVIDFVFSNNGTTGTNAGATCNGSNIAFVRCVAHDIRGSGIQLGTGGSTVNYAIECEAFACNTSNDSSSAGFRGLAAPAHFHRCISHDNSAGSNCAGFRQANNSIMHLIGCIADSNAGDGMIDISQIAGQVIGCDFYNNSGDGIDLANTTNVIVHIENCNFVKNGGWGINGSGSAGRCGIVRNCAFGAGTQANTSGTKTGLKSIQELGSVNYASDVNPWTDPANGDFRINLAAAKGAGWGSYTQTASSYAGTVSYPNIGAAQHQDAGGGTTLFVPVE